MQLLVSFLNFSALTSNHGNSGPVTAGSSLSDRIEPSEEEFEFWLQLSQRPAERGPEFWEFWLLKDDI